MIVGCNILHDLITPAFGCQRKERSSLCAVNHPVQQCNSCIFSVCSNLFFFTTRFGKWRLLSTLFFTIVMTPSLSIPKTFANNFWVSVLMESRQCRVKSNDTHTQGKEDAGYNVLMHKMNMAKKTCDDLKSFYNTKYD